MTYTLVFYERANREFNESLAWYQERSIQASEDFEDAVKSTIARIEAQPGSFRKTYKNFREAKAGKFPYKVIYFINEKNKEIVVTTIFHQKPNPQKKFTR